MNKNFKIVTILGRPHDTKSNTRAFVEDFVEEMEKAGLALEHEVIPLGRRNVKPCKGCWNCTNKRLCPIKDDLQEIKIKMIECDMLILASPVYTNQVTAQMKAFCDRLFTWCHIYTLLGKYSLSVVTTGNDGHKETGSFLEWTSLLRCSKLAERNKLQVILQSIICCVNLILMSQNL